jgi:hypothetical protein
MSREKKNETVFIVDTIKLTYREDLLCFDFRFERLGCLVHLQVATKFLLAFKVRITNQAGPGLHFFVVAPVMFLQI